MQSSGRNCFQPPIRCFSSWYSQGSSFPEEGLFHRHRYGRRTIRGPRRRLAARPPASPGRWPDRGDNQKCTSKGIWRQGIVLKHRNVLQKKLCPVVICPYLCSETTFIFRQSNKCMRCTSFSKRARAVCASLALGERATLTLNNYTLYTVYMSTKESSAMLSLRQPCQKFVYHCCYQYNVYVHIYIYIYEHRRVSYLLVACLTNPNSRVGSRACRVAGAGAPLRTLNKKWHNNTLYYIYNIMCVHIYIYIYNMSYIYIYTYIYIYIYIASPNSASTSSSTSYFVSIQ